MEVLKKLLMEFKERGIPKDLIERDLKIDWMRKKANVFVGIRRAGKTYSVFQSLSRFNFRDVFYINMEDDRIINPNIRHLTELIPTIKETFKTNKQIYLFVDEIQNVEGWEKWAKRIAEDPNIILFISGSSSKLSSFEIPTVLRGRTITNYIFPLSFKEFLKFKNFDYTAKSLSYSSKKPELMRLLNEYLSYGGFPEIVLVEEDTKKLKLLKEYFSTIIARDIIERYKIENILALETFMKYIINNYSRYISFSKAHKWMKSIGIKIGKATLMEYYRYIKQSFFVNHTSIFSYKIKDVLQYPIKIYVADHGFVNALSIKQKNMGHLYEQQVANELFKRAVSDPSVELSYWKNPLHEEVDFVVRKGLNVEQLIQVCYDISYPKTKTREIKALLKASDELKCKNLLVITKDYEKEEVEDGNKIKYIPLWKWLLEEHKLKKPK